MARIEADTAGEICGPAKGLELPSLPRSAEFEEEVAKIYAGTAPDVPGRKRPFDVPAMAVEMMNDAIWSERLPLHKESPVDSAPGQLHHKSFPE
jgi:hypothetical protein